MKKMLEAKVAQKPAWSEKCQQHRPAKPTGRQGRTLPRKSHPFLTKEAG